MTAAPPALFDRAAVAMHLSRAARRPETGANFLMARACEDLADRLSVTNRSFPDAVDLGSPTEGAAAALRASGKTGAVLRLAPPGTDLENPSLVPEGADLIVSLLALQFVNDLPGALIQIRRALKPGGLFLGALVGGDTLTELRQSFLRAEGERGGAAPRVAPFVDVKSAGALLQRAGFKLPVTDVDRVTARYGGLFGLFADLRAMGAANPLAERSRKPLRRELLFAVAQEYAANFADPDGKLRATFDVVWLSGWAADEGAGDG